MNTTDTDARHLLIAAFRALSASSSAPQLLLRLDGEILAASEPATRLLGSKRAKIEGTQLERWIDTTGPQAVDLLKSFARSTSALPGSLTVLGADGERIPCRCEGGRVVFDGGAAREPALVMQLRPKTAARSRFTVLTQQLIDLRREVARRRHAEQLLEHQKGLLELIVGNHQLADVLAAIARFIEAHSDHCLCSILLLDESGRRLTFGAAPSLPSAYNEAIDGLEIGPAVGSCGTAAHSGEAVLVEDISTSPLWADYKDLAAKHGLAACWSEPIKGPEGKILGTLAMYYRQPGPPTSDDIYLTAIGVDLTAIAVLSDRSRATLRLRAQQLAEADRRKDQFLAMLSHELRNPLAPIVNTIEILGVESDDPELLAHIDRLKRQTTHLSRLVDDLLDISRIAHGAVELRVTRVDLRESLAQAIDSAQDLVTEKRQSLRAPKPEKPIWVQGDSDRLRQVFSNLLINAAKYTQAEGAIEVELECDHGMAVIRVRDNGQGLTPEVRGRLFEPFAQGGRSALDSREGLGLGLALVKQLVECHNGEITVESEGPGKGSEFSVRLPLATGIETAKVVAEKPSELEQRNLKVLLVEDNEDSAEALAVLLGLWGHESMVCHDGNQAVDRAREYEPDVLLMDIDLPGQDGYSVLRALRRGGFSTENRLAVAMTGFGRVGDVSDSKAAGFHHHMTKPADPRALRKLLNDFSATGRA